MNDLIKLSGKDGMEIVATASTLKNLPPEAIETGEIFF
jgi:CO dehydrogenase/acetyl-CoA synthase epsilon subunit